MRMFTCLAALLALSAPAKAQDNPAVAAAAGQLAELTLRVTTIEQRLAAVESQLGVGIRGAAAPTQMTAVPTMAAAAYFAPFQGGQFGAGDAGGCASGSCGAAAPQRVGRVGLFRRR